MAADEQVPERIHQACVIPTRKREDRVEFCLITSLKRKRWMFPKGIVDPGETLEETALKEALEEAGVHGQIVGEPLGTYEDAKWGTTLQVTVVLMQVTACDDHWPEADVRQRRWVPADKAPRMLSNTSLRRFAEIAIRQLGTG